MWCMCVGAYARTPYIYSKILHGLGREWTIWDIFNKPRARTYSHPPKHRVRSQVIEKLEKAKKAVMCNCFKVLPVHGGGEINRHLDNGNCDQLSPSQLLRFECK